ncbi:hypothetical protein A1OQ_15570 [Enterovibrio norvegicus FF-162]|uniref:Uncharacterized protein n=1 Tax=Enterovibrio norvegicus FF-454 TaxID=1185651 RepID=A0A1E5C0C3_9GAMM|nr:hypothetical protein [Enterovibrio norvegicus]OEE58978.1 hypothetical protein A1OK_02940 [Enterovibrio norvegicus FF-454]OEE87349.1 hypothetical protein A1OQ_15570 [Enterovibrio norvegicus FF-162]
MLKTGMKKNCLLALLLVAPFVNAKSTFDQSELRTMLNGHELSGSPWVFEESDEINYFTFLREERNQEYLEYFVYMSLRAEKACHNVLSLITINTHSDELESVDMVHHAPAKRCLTYKEFKNP